MKVLFFPEVREYLKDISQIMYEKEYFGFLESSEKYIEELMDDIVTTLPIRMKKPAPPIFDKYGKKMLYSTFRKNNTTQWYVFYNIYQQRGEMIFAIRYISNNHLIAHFL